jgi:hypothetical protein
MLFITLQFREEDWVLESKIRKTELYFLMG